MSINEPTLGTKIFNIGAITASAGIAGSIAFDRGCHSNSIFGSGCGFPMGGYSMGGFGLGNFGGCGFPMGGFRLGNFGGFGLGGFGLGGFGLGNFGFSGAMMPMGNNLFALQEARNYGFAIGKAQVQARLEAENQIKIAQGLIKVDNPKADKVDSKFDTTKGQSVDKFISDAVAEKGNIKDVKHDLVSDNVFATDKSSKETVNEYRSEINTLGKSYLMNIDKTHGDSDGYISETELIKFAQSKVDTSLSGEEKAQALKNAETEAKLQFKKIDQNSDNTVDWKETASLMYAMDNYKKEITDGQISGKDVATFDLLMSNSNENQADVELRKGYHNLFRVE